MADEGTQNSHRLAITAGLLLGITYLSVGLRVYVRTVLMNNFLLDDWLMLAAQAIFTLSCSFILAGVGSGLGHHNNDLDTKTEIDALMWQALATATYVANMMFIKVSIAVFLLRLAVGKVYKYILWASMAIIFIWSTVLFLWDIFQCTPVQAQWDFTITNARCVSADAIVSAAYALSVMTILTDWLYALLPIPMVWNVKMTVQAKATVVVILGLGVFASIATLIRLKFLADLTDTSDILFAGTDAMIWTLIEPGVAITAASLVTIRPLLRAWRIRGFQSSGHSKSYGLGGRSGGRSGTGGRAGAGAGGYGGGGRSGAQRSITQRSIGGSTMPGFGSEDMGLADIEMGKTTTVISSAGSMKRPPPTLQGVRGKRSVDITKDVFVERGLAPVPAPPLSATESEEFVIEGARRGAEGDGSGKDETDVDEWPGQRPVTSGTAGSDVGYDAQSQHDGRVGLGGVRYA